MKSKGGCEMIVLNVTYHCFQGMREKFLEAIMAEGLDAACRAEKGNIKYDYYMSAERDDEMLLVEKWCDAEALAEHGKMPHFARIGEIKGDFVENTVVEKYIIPEQ